jgi:hypothetical protein
MDDRLLRIGIDKLEDVEKLLFGLAIDTEKDDVHLDITTVLKADAAAVASLKDAGKAASTIASPATADGKQAALRGHYVVNVPAEGRAAVRAGLDEALEQADDDPPSRVVASLVRDLVAAMLDTGTIDTGFTVDTSAADSTSPLPSVTVGMKVKDGAALQKQVKERLGKADALPPQVKAAFDTGKEGSATLHEITVDVSGTPAAERLGESVKLTLAVTPDHAYLLTGGDVKKRLAAALAAGGKPMAEAAPFAGVDASLAAIMRHERVHLTVDLDCFAAAYAPGVSAPTPLGVGPEAAESIRRCIASCRVRGADLAELAPALDADGRTARLAAALAFEIVDAWSMLR